MLTFEFVRQQNKLWFDGFDARLYYFYQRVGTEHTFCVRGFRKALRAIGFETPDRHENRVWVALSTKKFRGSVPVSLAREARGLVNLNGWRVHSVFFDTATDNCLVHDQQYKVYVKVWYGRDTE